MLAFYLIRFGNCKTLLTTTIYNYFIQNKNCLKLYKTQHFISLFLKYPHQLVQLTVEF